MRFESFISTNESTDAAAQQIIDAARSANIDPDALFIFFTGHHVPDSERMIEKLWLELDPQVAVGCSGEGVIGGDQEIERAPGLAVLVAHLPNVRIHPFHVSKQECVDPNRLLERLGVLDDSRAIIAFGDPFTTPINQIFPFLDEAAPHAPLVGGMASAARRPGDNVLVRNDQTHTEGLVGLTLSGPLQVETIVSQGCRPIGKTFVITKSQENVIQHLGGKTALQALQEIVNDLPEQDQALLQHGLLMGLAISEYRERFGRGDFLIRNLMGIDQNSGAIAVADYVRTGQTVQFHVRDAQTADEDLRLMLDAQQVSDPAAGALLFSCNGRGTRLFDEPCHDITVAHRAMTNTPIAGFFAAGELGPVGGRNFIHGHTASFALFRPTQD